MSSNTNSSFTDVSDAELATLAAGSDKAAFEELYRRHVAAAWRIAQAVSSDTEEAASAVAAGFVRVLQSLQRGHLASPDHFRPYLLSTTRRAAVDQLRKAGRLRPSADDEEDVEPASSDLPAMGGAFRSLPERWRTAVWLSAVEGMSAAEMAPILAVSANAAAQLAARSRAGLRERYLQAALATEADQVCRFTTERLGAYASETLPARDARKIEKHVADCPTCNARCADLGDIAASLRRAMVPIPLTLAAATLSRWHLAFGLNTPAKRAAGMAPFGSYTRPIAIGAAAAAAIGIVGATIWGQPKHPRPSSPRVALAAPALATPLTTDAVSSAGGTPTYAAYVPESRGTAVDAMLTSAQGPAISDSGSTPASSGNSSAPGTPPSDHGSPPSGGGGGGGGGTTIPPLPVPTTLPPLPVPTTLPPPLGTLPTLPVATTLPPLPVTLPVPTTLPQTPFGPPIPPVTAPVTTPTLPVTTPTLPVTVPATLPVATTLPPLP